MRLFIRLGVLVVAATVATISLRSQASTPTRLLQKSDLVYQGAFRLPRTNDNTTYSYGGTALSYRASTNSLVVVGHDWYQLVGEVTVPTPGTATAVSGLPTAAARVVPHDLLAGKLAQVNPSSTNAKKIGGTFPMADGSLLLTGYDTYDGGGTAEKSHFSVSSSGAVTGPYLVAQAGFTSGWMLPIPGEWQGPLGATALTGNCCLSVIGRTSVGPSVTLFDPSVRADQPNAKMVLGYPLDHATLGKPENPTDLYTMTSIIRGAVFPAGSSSVLFFGAHGTTSCYGGGTADQALAGTKAADGTVWCYDPTNSAKGSHGYPYVSRVWAYDANELVAVKNGQKQPWEVLPYTTWTFDLPFQGAGRFITGAAYDPATQRIFLGSQYGDSDGYPLIHVFQVGQLSSGPSDTQSPSVALTQPVAGASLSNTVSLTATASDDTGVASVWFSIDAVTVGSEDSSLPYSGTFKATDFANGAHTLRAVARDAAGNTATSAPVAIVIANTAPLPGDSVPPAVTLTAPAPGSAAAGSLTLAANATDNVGVAGVQFLVDGTNVGAFDTTAPFSTTWASTTVANGSHSVQASARDAAGNATVTSAITITVNNAATGGDTTAPVVAITTPSNATTVSGTTRVAASASDNVGVSQVVFSVDGRVIGTSVTGGAYGVSWNTSGFANGFHRISAIARDAAGNTATSTVTVRVWNGWARRGQ